MIQIRELKQEDWGVWRTLRIAALRDAPDAFGDTVAQAQQRSDEEWLKSLAHPEERLLVAEIDSELVGMARVRRDGDDPERAGLYSMWVAPDARRRGVGRALIDAAIRWAAQNGVLSLWLCVTQGNEPAKSLYRSFGFKETGALRPLRSGSDKQMDEMQVSLDATSCIRNGVRKRSGERVSNAETVQAIYEAFGRGDVSVILDKLDDAVEWETTAPVHDVPWLQARRGKANIVGFFESLAPLKITRFEPHTIFDGGDKVFVLINFEATVRGKGYSFPNNGHLWQFSATGKVVKYDHITDTAQMIRMAKGE